MKITAVHNDGTEDVVFADGDNLPGNDGRLGDDGYRYQPTGTRTYRRAMVAPPTMPPDLSDLVEDMHRVANEHPADTVGELRDRVLGTAWEGCSAEDVQAALDFILEQRYQRGVRFASNLAQLRAKAPGAIESWATALRDPAKQRATFTRAGHHMNGEQLADTPFASMALSEGQVLKHAEVSLCAVLYGSESSGAHMQATHIFQLRVPTAALITLVRISSQVKLPPALEHMVGHETEVLYYGHDLERYVTGSRPNPYTREDQARLQPAPQPEKPDKSDKSEEDAAPIVSPSPPSPSPSPEPAALDMTKIGTGWAEFQRTVVPWLTSHAVTIRERYTIDLAKSDIQQVLTAPTFNRASGGRFLRTLDARLQGDADLSAEWKALATPFST